MNGSHEGNAMISHEALFATFGEAMILELLEVVRWYDAPTLGPAPRVSGTLARAFLQTARDMGIDIDAFKPTREE